MVTATEWLKKAGAKRSKNSSGFKAVQRRAWDYVGSSQESETSSSANEPANIWERKEEQNGNDNRNNWEQNGNDNRNNWERKEEQNGNEYRNEYRNKKPIKSSMQIVYLDDNIARKRVLTLTGHQKEIMKHITSHLKSRVGESHVIDVLPHILAIKIQAGLEVTRVALKRLTGKNLIMRQPGERGRNGCCKFKVQENIIKICFSLFNDPPCEINYIGNEIGNKNRNNLVYSSSNNINTTTSLPEEWSKINHQLLGSIGFSETQLRQLCQSEMTTPEIVQDAINRFAYSLEHNSKVKAYSDPLNVLMGVLRKGQRWIEPNYIPPKELALQQMVEEKRKQKEQRDLIIKELIELEFPDWKRKLTEDDIKTIVPIDIRKTNLTAAVNASLRTYFVDRILLPRLDIKVKE